ncbi:hypothetical protein CC2G_001810 [Coprinopsis cinerea AmutBmut pab1-1]|nr:hypothetical protein CC2G_001810 [Coprinopsis cinerea AmutBmut pab1-1]
MSTPQPATLSGCEAFFSPQQFLIQIGDQRLQIDDNAETFRLFRSSPYLRQCWNFIVDHLNRFLGQFRFEEAFIYSPEWDFLSFATYNDLCILQRLPGGHSLMAVRAYTMAFMTVYQGNDGPPGHPRYPLTAPYSWRAWAEPVHRNMGIRRMMNIVFTDPQMAILRLTRPIVPSTDAEMPFLIPRRLRDNTLRGWRLISPPALPMDWATWRADPHYQHWHIYIDVAVSFEEALAKYRRERAAWLADHTSPPPGTPVIRHPHPQLPRLTVRPRNFPPGVVLPPTALLRGEGRDSAPASLSPSGTSSLERQVFGTSASVSQAAPASSVPPVSTLDDRRSASSSVVASGTGLDDGDAVDELDPSPSGEDVHQEAPRTPRRSRSLQVSPKTPKTPGIPPIPATPSSARKIVPIPGQPAVYGPSSFPRAPKGPQASTRYTGTGPRNLESIDGELFHPPSVGFNPIVRRDGVDDPTGFLSQGRDTTPLELQFSQRTGVSIQHLSREERQAHYLRPPVPPKGSPSSSSSSSSSNSEGGSSDARDDSSRSSSNPFVGSLRRNMPTAQRQTTDLRNILYQNLTGIMGSRRLLSDHALVVGPCARCAFLGIPRCEYRGPGLSCGNCGRADKPCPFSLNIDARRGLRNQLAGAAEGSSHYIDTVVRDILHQSNVVRDSLNQYLTHSLHLYELHARLLSAIYRLETSEGPEAIVVEFFNNDFDAYLEFRSMFTFDNFLVGADGSTVNKAELVQRMDELFTRSRRASGVPIPDDELLPTVANPPHAPYVFGSFIAQEFPMAKDGRLWSPSQLDRPLDDEFDDFLDQDASSLPAFDPLVDPADGGPAPNDEDDFYDDRTGVAPSADVIIGDSLGLFSSEESPEWPGIEGSAMNIDERSSSALSSARSGGGASSSNSSDEGDLSDSPEY